MTAPLEPFVSKWKFIIQVLTWIGGLIHFGIWAVVYFQAHDLPPMAVFIKIALVTQTITLLLLLTSLQGPPPASEPESALAIVASRQFSVMWVGVWMTLASFWLARTLAEFTGSTEAFHYGLAICVRRPSVCLSISRHRRIRRSCESG